MSLHRGTYDPAYVAALQKDGGNAALASREVTDTSLLIKRYQIDRLLVFTDPALDPTGAGYNLAQSRIAIGSGGLTGVGLDLGGTNRVVSQSRLSFIPASYTDFIFAVLGEQLGLLGVLVLLALYLALLSSAMSVSSSSRDMFGALIAAGLVAMWAFQILQNAGMTMGMMPITGIPLPYMSYGSSFMVTNLAGVGVLLSIWSHRYGTSAQPLSSAGVLGSWRAGRRSPRVRLTRGPANAFRASRSDESRGQQSTIRRPREEVRAPRAGHSPRSG